MYKKIFKFYQLRIRENSLVTLLIALEKKFFLSIIPMEMSYFDEREIFRVGSREQERRANSWFASLDNIK